MSDIRIRLLYALTIMLFGWTTRCQADYIIAFHGSTCAPCKAQEPIEQQVIAEGYDVRPVLTDDYPQLVEYYRINRVPCYVYVLETPRGSFDSGRRIAGQCTAAQLRRLATIPTVTHVGAAVRSTVRGILGTPIIWEW